MNPGAPLLAHNLATPCLGCEPKARVTTFLLPTQVLKALLRSKSFIELFAIKAFHEDLGTISNIPMFVNPHSAFVKLSLCYA